MRLDHLLREVAFHPAVAVDCAVAFLVGVGYLFLRSSGDRSSRAAALGGVALFPVAIGTFHAARLTIPFRRMASATGVGPEGAAALFFASRASMLVALVFAGLTAGVGLAAFTLLGRSSEVRSEAGARSGPPPPPTGLMTGRVALLAISAAFLFFLPALDYLFPDWVVRELARGEESLASLSPWVFLDVIGLLLLSALAAILSVGTTLTLSFEAAPSREARDRGGISIILLAMLLVASAFSFVNWHQLEILDRLAVTADPVRSAPLSSGVAAPSPGAAAASDAVPRPSSSVVAPVDGAPEEPLKVGGDVSEPVEISRVAPEYPEAARLMRQQGVVILEAVIDAEGGVSRAKVLRGVSPLLDTSALGAVSKWKYRPATKAGRAVPVYLTVTVTFRLK